MPRWSLECFSKRTREQNTFTPKYRDAHDTLIKVPLIKQRNPNQFLELSTIARKSGVGFVRDVLRVADYSSGGRPKLSPSVTAAAAKVIKTTETENIPLQELIEKTDGTLDNMKYGLFAQCNDKHRDGISPPP